MSTQIEGRNQFSDTSGVHAFSAPVSSFHGRFELSGDSEASIAEVRVKRVSRRVNRRASPRRVQEKARKPK